MALEADYERGKTPYQKGQNPVDCRRGSGAKFQAKWEPKKRKKIAQCARYEVSCQVCGMKFWALESQVNSKSRRHYCGLCVSKKNTKAFSWFDRAVRSDAYSASKAQNWRLTCLRCGHVWASNHYPRGGWVCPIGPEHPIQAEPL